MEQLQLNNRHIIFSKFWDLWIYYTSKREDSVLR